MKSIFDLVKQAGFDFVRLPIRWDAHADMNAPYTIDPAFFARIDQVVSWALKISSILFLDFHNFGGIMTDPNG